MPWPTGAVVSIAKRHVTHRISKFLELVSRRQRFRSSESIEKFDFPRVHKFSTYGSWCES